MYTALSNIKTALSGVTGVNTCKIGIENSLSPDDYPIIRIVPQLIEPGDCIPRYKYTVHIYFGLPVSESDGGLESVYEALSDLADAIRVSMESSSDFAALWQDTLLDDDRVDKYKLGMARFVVVA